MFKGSLSLSVLLVSALVFTASVQAEKLGDDYNNVNGGSTTKKVAKKATCEGTEIEVATATDKNVTSSTYCVAKTNLDEAKLEKMSKDETDAFLAKEAKLAKETGKLLRSKTYSKDDYENGVTEEQCRWGWGGGWGWGGWRGGWGWNGGWGWGNSWAVSTVWVQPVWTVGIGVGCGCGGWGW